MLSVQLPCKKYSYLGPEYKQKHKLNLSEQDFNSQPHTPHANTVNPEPTKANEKNNTQCIYIIKPTTTGTYILKIPQLTYFI